MERGSEDGGTIGDKLSGIRDLEREGEKEEGREGRRGHTETNETKREMKNWH
jgi:hypothetical protein